jgi:hypothetical protein
MAISLAFGVVFSSTITLILVPSSYLILDDLLGLIGQRDDQGGPSSRFARDIAEMPLRATEGAVEGASDQQTGIRNAG